MKSMAQIESIAEKQRVKISELREKLDMGDASPRRVCQRLKKRLG